MKKIFLLIIFSCSMPFFLIAERSSSSEFMKGYIYSKLEDRFSNASIEVDVDNEDIIVYSWPVDLECEVIKNYLESFCPDYCIQFNSLHQVSCEESLGNIDSLEEGNFLPELNPFFPTMLAQPHILGYSVGYRSSDQVFKRSLPVSIGDQFSLYQLKINSCARLSFGIEACVWAVFEAKTKSLSLINADYYVAFPLTYINNEFSARLRLFHQSSHLGDEFLLENPQIFRVNPSMEGIDLSLAYEPIDKIVLFIGYSRILRSDDSFKIEPNKLYYGFNCFLDCAKIQTFYGEAIPYFAAYIENHENNHWNFDNSISLGYQWEKYYGHKLRVYVEGHDGYSAEGQFARKRSKYVSINLLYGY